MTMTDSAYINIAHGIDNTRIYREAGVFFSYTATRDAIMPFSDKRAQRMAQHIMVMVEGNKGEANLTLGYPDTWSRRKKSRVNSLIMTGITDFDVKHLMPWLCLLLN
jgi:hypothetical protein